MADFYTMSCITCGVEFGMTKHLYARRQEDEKQFFCTNGHSAVFKESTSTKLQRELDRARQRLAEKDDAIAHQRRMREAAERSAAAHKGQVTRMKKRAEHGVCPCCNRTFIQLARHMKTKHPDFGADNVVELGHGSRKLGGP